MGEIIPFVDITPKMETDIFQATDSFEFRLSVVICGTVDYKNRYNYEWKIVILFCLSWRIARKAEACNRRPSKKVQTLCEAPPESYTVTKRPSVQKKKHVP